MCILYAFYFRHMCVFDVIMIIMFWGVIRKYVSLSSICLPPKKKGWKVESKEGGLTKKKEKGGKKRGKEKEKGRGIFFTYHVKSKRGRGFVAFFPKPKPQPQPMHREAERREEEEEKEKKKKEKKFGVLILKSI